jgi:hypothetical protein
MLVLTIPTSGGLHMVLHMFGGFSPETACNLRAYPHCHDAPFDFCGLGSNSTNIGGGYSICRERTTASIFINPISRCTRSRYVPDRAS